MARVQINRSDVASFIPATLNAGELFYNSADNKLYIGNPDSSVVLVADDPAVIESRLTALEADSHKHTVSATAPTVATTGDLWFNSSNSQLYIHDGTEFKLANDPYMLSQVGQLDANAVSVSDLAAHLRFTPDAAEEIELERMIASATLFAEHYTGRFLILRTVEQIFDEFPSDMYNRSAQYLKLRGGEANSISSVTYYDTDFVEQTLDSSKYRILTKLGSTKLFPALGEKFPTDVAEDVGVITVTYNVGDTPADLPSPIKSAVLLIAASLFENRENEVIGQGIAMLKPIVAAKDLLHPYKVR